MRKRILTVLAGLVLTLGIGAVAATPAFATWHGTCPSFHNGDLCLFTGFNGTGSTTHIAEDSVFQGECIDLTGTGFDNDIESLTINWVHFAPSFSRDNTCFADNHTYFSANNYNVSVEDPGSEDTYSSIQVLLVI